jgi:catechol 2,3-dioxygenase-like lactoylglutathione lyase family enzyme
MAHFHHLMTAPFLIVFARHSSSPSSSDDAWWMLALVVALLVLKIISGRRKSRRNKERIVEYFAARGSEALFYYHELPGGRRSRTSTFYDVRFRDPDGMEFIAHCWVDGDKVNISGLEPVKEAITRQPGKPAPFLRPQLPDVGTAGPRDFSIHGLDHVQLAMPFGEEEIARRFYGALLGLKEISRPADGSKHGGLWFEGGNLKLHLGVDIRFDPALKAHPALLVNNLPALVTWLEKHGVNPVAGGPLPGCRNVYVSDPFQNRIELLERLPAES